MESKLSLSTPLISGSLSVSDKVTGVVLVFSGLGLLTAGLLMLSNTKR